jgi:hypothetical protein
MYNWIQKSYNGSNFYEAEGNCKLVSISDVSHKNSNQTEYMWAKVEIANANGEVVTADAQVYKTNFEKDAYVAGNSYKCTLRVTTEGPQADKLLILVAPFDGNAQVSASEFGFVAAAIPVAAPATVETPAAAVEEVF